MKMYPNAAWDFTPTTAHMNPFMDTASNMPFVTAGDRNFGAEPLFKSHRDIALLTDKMTIGGLGRLPQGLLMAVVKDGKRKGSVFPHELAVPLTAGTSAGAKAFVIANEHAAIFCVGDVLQAREGAGNWASIGTVETIVSDATKTTITTSTASTGALTVAGAITFENNGAVCVLDATVVTGDAGAYGSVAYSNMVLYSAQIKNATDAVLEKMGAIEDGIYTIFK